MTGGQRVQRLDATWPAGDGPAGLEAALDRLATRGRRRVRGRRRDPRAERRDFSLERLPIPSILAVGAVHTALTDAGLRGRTDIVADAADVLDVHSMAMLLAVGATAVHPRLAIELAAELAGTRGAETVTAADAIDNLVAAFEAGLRKTLARMGISAVASYIGGALIDVIDLDAGRGRAVLPDGRRVARSDDASRTSPTRQLRRADAAAAAIAPPAPGREPRLPDPGWARFRADGEAHLFAPKIATEITTLATTDDPAGIDVALARYRGALARGSADRAVPRDELRVRSTADDRGPRRCRGRAQHRATLRRVGDERRRAVARSPPGADDRHPARRRRREHRRGRGGPGLVHARRRRPASRRAGSSRSPRRGSA